MSPTETAQLQSMERKIDSLIDNTSKMNTTMSSTLADHGAQLNQIKDDKSTIFDLINNKLLPSIDELKIKDATIQESIRYQDEKIVDNKKALTRGLTSLREELETVEKKSQESEKEQEEKILALIKVQDESEGSRKTWQKINGAVMLLIALLGLYAAFVVDK